MAPAVGQAGAGDGLALDEVGELLADRGPGPEPLLAEEERRDAAGVLLVGGVAVQGQDDVGAAVVGEGGAGLVVPRAGEPGPRVDDVGPVGAEAALDAAGEVVDDLRLDDAVGHGPGIVAAVTRVEDDGAPAQAVPGPADVLALTERQRGTTGDAAAQVGERPEGRRTDLAVRAQADAALEGADRRLGVGPEEPVDPARVEAEAEESLLELGDVVAADQVPGGVSQQPVAELPLGCVERCVGPGPDDAVDEQPASLLERADGRVELLVEDLRGPVGRPVRGAVRGAVGGLTTQCPGGREAVAEVADDGSVVAESGLEAGTRFGHVPPSRSSRETGGLLDAGCGRSKTVRTIADAAAKSAPTHTGLREPAVRVGEPSPDLTDGRQLAM